MSDEITRTIRKTISGSGVSLAVMLAWQVLAPQAIPAQEKGDIPHEIGVVYYADGAGFHAIPMERAAVGGNPYAAKLQGPHAALRLNTETHQVFRVCGVDPSRYKLYTFRSTKNSRELVLTKFGLLSGKATSVGQESEVPVTIQPRDGDCFEITPKEVLKAGEYGFNPLSSEDFFMFGVD